MNPSPEVLTSPQGRNVTSDRDIVQRRYEELHPLDQDAQNSVARLLNATSLSQVNQYLDELTKAFEQVTPQMPIEACTWMWNLSLSAPIVSRDWHQSAWKIDHELNVKFLRLVFFHRYPKLAAAEPPISTPEMLEALAAPSHEAGEKLLKPAPANPTDVQHVQTLKDGYNHPYLRNDQIVKPILECLSEYAKNWKPEKYLAPYTALIGPSMSGKTRFLMQLSENICVIYICLRPHKSTGIPPRSVLADEFQLEMNAPEILVHYYRLLAALFDVVSDFFSTRTSDHNEKQLLLEWSDYNHQHGGKLATQVRRAMEKIGEEGPAASAAFKENLRKLATSTSFISNPGLKILLGIDEARALVEQGSGDAQNLSYFRALCRVLSKVPTQLNFFAIFTDTTSKVANFLPALQNDPSARPLPDSEEDSKELIHFWTLSGLVPHSQGYLLPSPMMDSTSRPTSLALPLNLGRPHQQTPVHPTTARQNPSPDPPSRRDSESSQSSEDEGSVAEASLPLSLDTTSSAHHPDLSSRYHILRSFVPRSSSLPTPF
ncbi:hypothetical protein PtB15_1B300 [Puccinia triticina]|nr:hypothetical protein PtB15_1B300 [Puccinia triticina]